MYRRQ
jgi:hypothetical protein